MYTQYTLVGVAAEISAALQDTSNVYWSLDEVYRAIREGLLHWGLLTSYWRERGLFPTVAGTFDYDCSTLLPTLRAQAYTLGDLTREAQYHLLEPANGVLGVGMSDQIPIFALTLALARARNEYTLDAQTPLVAGDFAAAPPPTGRMPLDQSVVLVQRMAWKDLTTGIYHPLRRQDALASDSANYLWNLTPHLPFAYSTAETRPIEVQFIPPPAANGRLYLVYVESRNLAIAEGTLLSVGDEAVHGVKWRALYELLAGQGQAYDPLRARYCLERYNAFVRAAGQAKSILRVQVNDRTLQLDTLWNLDCKRPRWMNQLGTPNLAAVAGDIIWLSKVPDIAYAVTVDTVRTAPLPVLPADFVQIGREELPYIFDYARHILSFKLGGSEFVSTMPLYDNFLRGAAQRNKILAAQARYLTALFEQPQKAAEVGDVPA